MSPDQAIRNPNEADIGMCDDCGTEDGNRYRTIVSGVWADGPGRCIAWLCGPCKRARQVAQTGGDDR